MININKTHAWSFSLVFATSAIAIFFWLKLTIDPHIYFLTPHHSADWIKHDGPVSLKAQEIQKKVTTFKKTFTTKSDIKNARIDVRAFKYFRLFLDEELVFQSPTQPEKWKQIFNINISTVPRGEHELVIFVMNTDGPTALLAYSQALQIKTDDSWISSRTTEAWSPVRLADHFSELEISTKFIPGYRALLHNLEYIIIITIVVLITWRATKSRHWEHKFNLSSASTIKILRYSLILLWVALSVNSLVHFPVAGMDFPYHLQYISYVAKNWAIPLATDGAQMFQSPLYYIISALLWKALNWFLDPQSSLIFLKIVPLLCGLGMIEISYRTMNTAFPNRIYPQAIGLVLAALMPMNLYMSQYIGNETLCAFFSAAAILLTLQLIKSPELSQNNKHVFLLGATLGLGLLSKVTTLLLVLPILVAVAWSLHSSNISIKNILVVCTKIALVIFIIAGWYYIRNFMLLGKPFIGGWDPSRGIGWWQFPGYRTISQFSSFGYSLVYPVYSSIIGFWDSLYSTFWMDGFLGGNISYTHKPNWNYTFALSVPLLSVLPTTGILIGAISMVKTVNHKEKAILLFSATSIIIYLLAIFFIFLVVPTYSSAKATYSMGLIPCYAVLAAKGFDIVSQQTGIRLLLTILVVSWAIFSYIGYFAV